ncbi:MAG: bifunctional phosphoglucose/phosphomannose isomerase [Bacteroidia bacterium]|jgi:glucose/mannose-6-phosphate isomerase|nr:bifunctional phosphoglucose/phosphomannose isomerase [Bacteroidia bacterium]
MKELVQNFSTQLREAKSIAEKALVAPGKNIQNIVISGLGGSGIGGSIVSELISDSCLVPVCINKDYHLPAFVSASTLLIISSYSGNTEETLSAMEQGMAKQAQIVCISSGGKVLELAKQHQFDFIEIPGGFPPRSCIGYSLVQLLKVMVNKGFAKASLFTDLDKAIQLLDKESASLKKEAMEIASALKGKIPVIYSLGSSEGVAVRFRQQINENSKMLCWHHTFPEMNHNELVGWTEKNESLVVVTFHTSFDYKRTLKRYEVCKPIFQKYSSGVIDITAKGESKLEQFLYLIHIGDWISCYIADLKGIDAVEVNVINHLKSELSKF